jgi:hypothetical protein
MVITMACLGARLAVAMAKQVDLVKQQGLPRVGARLAQARAKREDWK